MGFTYKKNLSSIILFLNIQYWYILNLNFVRSYSTNNIVRNILVPLKYLHYIISFRQLCKYDFNKAFDATEFYLNVAGQSVSKSVTWRHKNEEDEWRSGKENPKKEMDNHSFLWRHMADLYIIQLCGWGRRRKSLK